MAFLPAVLDFADELVQQEVFEITDLPSFQRPTAPAAPPPVAPPTPPSTNPLINPTSANPLNNLKPTTRPAPRQKLVPLPIPSPKTPPPQISVLEDSDFEEVDAVDSAEESQVSRLSSKRPRKSSPKEQPVSKKVKSSKPPRNTEALRKLAELVLRQDFSNQTVVEGARVDPAIAKLLPKVKSLLRFLLSLPPLTTSPALRGVQELFVQHDLASLLPEVGPGMVLSVPGQADRLFAQQDILRTSTSNRGVATSPGCGRAVAHHRVRATDEEIGFRRHQAEGSDRNQE